MLYCRSCKYLSPSESIYCGSCGRSFGGRRCPNHHLSPPDSRVCVQCGTPELSEATPSLAPLGTVRIVGIIVSGLVLFATLPSLLRGAQNQMSFAWHRLFNIMALDRALAYVLICTFLLNLLPGEFGRVVRRNLARALDMALRGFLYFLAGIPRLIAAIIFTSSRRR